MTSLAAPLLSRDAAMPVGLVPQSPTTAPLVGSDEEQPDLEQAEQELATRAGLPQHIAAFTSGLARHADHLTLKALAVAAGFCAALDSRLARYILKGTAIANPEPEWFMLRVQRLRRFVLFFWTLDFAAGALMLLALVQSLLAYHSVGPVAPDRLPDNPCADLMDWIGPWAAFFMWQFYMRSIVAMTFASAVATTGDRLTDVYVLPVYFMIPTVMLVYAVRFRVATADSPECLAAQPAVYAFSGGQVMMVFVMFVLSVAAGVLLRAFQNIARQTWHVFQGASGPADKAILEKIAADPEPSHADLRGAECAICLGELEPDEECRQLGCGHTFHLSCMLEWLSRSRKCPLCRHDLHLDYLKASGRTDTANQWQDDLVSGVSWSSAISW